MFTPAQRRIFRFYDGSKKRGMDPLEIQIALEAIDLDWEAQFLSFNLAQAKDAEKAIRREGMDAATAIVDAARKVFKIGEFNIDQETGEETGLSAEEVFDLLIHFVQWKASLANFTEPPATSQPSTDGAAAATESGTAST